MRHRHAVIVDRAQPPLTAQPFVGAKNLIAAAIVVFGMVLLSAAIKGVPTDPRFYGGLHYRFDITAGRNLGDAVAQWAVARAGLLD